MRPAIGQGELGLERSRPVDDPAEATGQDTQEDADARQQKDRRHGELDGVGDGGHFRGWQAHAVELPAAGAASRRRRT